MESLACKRAASARTVTVSVLVCPVVSVAAASMVTVPLVSVVVSRLTVYGALVSTPIDEPSTRKSTCVTPTKRC